MYAKDIYVGVFYLIIIYSVCYLYTGKLKDRQSKIFFLGGLTAKIVGAISLGLIYQFYYGGFDTFEIFECARVLDDAFFSKPSAFLQLLQLEAGGCYSHTIPWTDQLIPKYFVDSDSFFFIKVVSIVNLFTFQSYIGTAIIFALISFLSSWLLFTSLAQLYPGLKKALAIAILFIPSVIFWGSGILKDTLAITMLNLLIFLSIKLLFRREYNFHYISFFIISLLLMLKLKPYLFFLTIGVLIFTIGFFFIKRFEIRPLYKAGLNLFVILGLCLAAYWVPGSMGWESGKYSLKKIDRTIQDHHNWNAREGQAASYSLGNSGGNILSALQKVPQAINVALFRPYIWEIKNPLMLLASLESFLILVFTVFVFWKAGIRNVWQSMLQNPVVFFSLVISISLAFFIGLATYNFGALSRYRIPLIPLYAIGLLLILNTTGIGIGITGFGKSKEANQ